MTGFEDLREEQRNFCSEDVNLLITRTENGKVRIKESEGRIVDKSERGIRLVADDEVKNADSILIDCLSSEDKSATYSPYNIIWSNCNESISTLGCQLNDGHEHCDNTSVSGVEDVPPPTKPRASAKELRDLIHDLNNHLSTVSMGIGLAKMDLDTTHSATAFLNDAEKSFVQISESLSRLYKILRS
jgi:hypothetical protein